MNVSQVGKMLIEKFPGSLKYIAPLHNFLLGGNRRKVKGCANKISGRSFLQASNILIVGNNNSIDFGEVCLLDGCNICIYGNNNRISIGEKCSLKNIDFWIEDDENHIEIGDNTSVRGSTHLAATEGKKIIIGRDCMFSSDIIIRTGDSHSIIDISSQSRINLASDVMIGDHVWMGNQTIVLKGSCVPSNSIVATAAVVTKVHIQNNVILAGSPAKVIRENIDWTRERIKG